MKVRRRDMDLPMRSDRKMSITITMGNTMSTNHRNTLLGRRKLRMSGVYGRATLTMKCGYDLA